MSGFCLYEREVYTIDKTKNKCNVKEKQSMKKSLFFISFFVCTTSTHSQIVIRVSGGINLRQDSARGVVTGSIGYRWGEYLTHLASIDQRFGIDGGFPSYSGFQYLIGWSDNDNTELFTGPAVGLYYKAIGTTHENYMTYGYGWYHHMKKQWSVELYMLDHRKMKRQLQFSFVWHLPYGTKDRVYKQLVTCPRLL